MRDESECIPVLQLLDCLSQEGLRMKQRLKPACGLQGDFERRSQTSAKSLRKRCISTRKFFFPRGCHQLLSLFSARQSCSGKMDLADKTIGSKTAITQSIYLHKRQTTRKIALFSPQTQVKRTKSHNKKTKKKSMMYKE